MVIIFNLYFINIQYFGACCFKYSINFVLTKLLSHVSLPYKLLKFLGESSNYITVWEGYTFVINEM